MSAFSVENPHDGKMFENYTRFEWGVEVGVVTIFMLSLFVPREFDMKSNLEGLEYPLKCSSNNEMFILTTTVFYKLQFKITS